MFPFPEVAVLATRKSHFLGICIKSVSRGPSEGLMAWGGMRRRTKKAASCRRLISIYKSDRMIATRFTIAAISCSTRVATSSAFFVRFRMRVPLSPGPGPHADACHDREKGGRASGWPDGPPISVSPSSGFVSSRAPGPPSPPRGRRRGEPWPWRPSRIVPWAPGRRPCP